MEGLQVTGQIVFSSGTGAVIYAGGRSQREEVVPYVE
jgi:hypothetical protein